MGMNKTFVEEHTGNPVENSYINVRGFDINGDVVFQAFKDKATRDIGKQPFALINLFKWPNFPSEADKHANVDQLNNKVRREKLISDIKKLIYEAAVELDVQYNGDSLDFTEKDAILEEE